MVKYKSIIGKCGSGKTSGVVVPEIKKAIKERKSILVTDSRNEMLEYLGEDLFKENYNVILLNLRDGNQSDRWNPLLLPYKSFKSGDLDRAYALLNDIADTIFYTHSEGRNDPFWDISSKELFTGLAFGLFEDANSEDEINLRSILNMEMIGNKKTGGGTTFLSEYYENKKNKFGYTAAGLRGTVVAPSDTKSSILSVFNQKLRHITMSEKYMSVLCGNSFDLEMCIKSKTAFILQFEDEKESSYLINMFIKQVYDLYIEKRSEVIGLSMFFEDFLSLEYIPFLSKLLMGAKNRDISLLFSINSLSIMYKTYGEYLCNALLENCDEILITEMFDMVLLKCLKEFVSCGQIAQEILSFKQGKYECVKIDKNKGVEYLKLSQSTKNKKVKLDKSMKGLKNEVGCFDFESFVINQRERKEEGMLRDSEMKDLIARIDKKIHELEELESNNNN